MIKIELMEKSFMRCQACYSEVEILEVSIGLTERQTSKFRLCKKCLEELKKKLVSNLQYTI